jgi:hypothetical protein
MKRLLILIFLFACFVLSANAEAVQIKTPGVYFGFKPGADRMLFDYETMIGYLRHVEEASPRLKLVEIGRSPMDKPLYIAFISDEENIRNLDALKRVNRKLALAADLSEEERAKLFTDGKVFMMFTMSMHAGEVGPAQSVPLIAYELAVTQSPAKTEWLKNVVLAVVPSHNPDGMDMIVNHYKKYKGTKYEGSSMPGVYHKYVGHDNNRDFVILSQSDNRAVAAVYNLEWFPQVLVEKHEMGTGGVRYFVPPYHDPIAENIDADVWNWIALFGSNMMKDMTAGGLAGVTRNYAFDDYWPGSTETSLWKNVISLLTESASAGYASPVYVEPNEIQIWGKGLAEYKKSINMPLPWPGGWWRLSDVVKYEVASLMSALKTASVHRGDILRFRNDLCRREVKNGKTKPPYYYILPLDQRDLSELVHLVNLLKEHGVAVYRLTAPVKVDNRNYQEGDIVVPLAQPFRPFIKEVMETQEYPVRHYTPGGKVIEPYDITSWSLPLHRGLTSVEVNKKTAVPKNFDSLLQAVEGDFHLKKQIPGDFRAALFSVNHNDSFKAVFMSLAKGLKVLRLEKAAEVNGKVFPKGSFAVFPDAGKRGALETVLDKLAVSPEFLEDTGTLDAVPAVPLHMPRIALVETWFHDMDAGWTRFILDTYGIPFKVIRPGDFETVDFKKNFDVVLFPNARKSILMKGKYGEEGNYYISRYPPAYTKGIGAKGLNRLLSFLNDGGTVVSWGNSTGLFMGELAITTGKKGKGKEEKEEFRLPVRDIAKGLGKAGLSCPGSLVRVLFREGHPLTLGMPAEAGVFFRGRPVFRTRVPHFDMDRRVIGKFPEKDILLSGYCEKEEQVGDQTALVWIRKNKGQLVLFAFGPQFRASTQGTFKLLFNAILLQPIR